MQQTAHQLLSSDWIKFSIFQIVYNYGHSDIHYFPRFWTSNSLLSNYLELELASVNSETSYYQLFIICDLRIVYFFCILNRVTRWKSSPHGHSDILKLYFPRFWTSNSLLSNYLELELALLSKEKIKSLQSIIHRLCVDKTTL